MRFEYKVTVSDMAEVLIRTQKSYSSIRTALWKGHLFVCVFIALLFYLALHEVRYLLLNLTEPIPLPELALATRLGVIGCGFLFAGLVLLISFKEINYKEMRKRAADIFALSCKHPILMELRPDCLWTRSNFTTTEVPWARITDIMDEDSAVIFRWEGDGSHYIPKEALRSGTQERAFLETARQYWTKARAIADDPELTTAIQAKDEYRG